jgi:CRP/FNR family transcriptional regulator, dissimilatory nitrate respiration regulator
MNDNLINCTLFKGLNHSDIIDLFSGIIFQEKKYAKDEIVAYAETEVKFLHLLIEGSVRGEMMDFTGKTVKIEDIESPGILAPAFLFGSNNKYPVSIISNHNATVLNIPKSDFIKILQKNSMVLNNYLDNISSRAQFLSGKLRFLAFQTIKGKLAHYFLQISNKSGKNNFVLPKSQNQLAEMFGVTRPSLGRAIRELDAEGIISAKGKEISILDKDRLNKFLK